MKVFLLEQDESGHWSPSEAEGEIISTAAGPILVEGREVEPWNWSILEWVAKEICAVRNRREERTP